MNIFPSSKIDVFHASTNTEEELHTVILLLKELDAKVEKLAGARNHSTADILPSPLPDVLRRLLAIHPHAEDLLKSLAGVLEKTRTPETLLEIVARSQDPAERIAEIMKLLQEANGRSNELAAQNKTLEHQLEENRLDRDAQQTEISVLRTELGATRQNLSAAKEKEAQLEKAGQELSDLRNRLATFDTLQAERNALAQEVHELRQRSEKTESAFACLQSELRGLASLRERMWPDCLRIPELESASVDWQRELTADSPDPTLLCMFSNIFSWACARELTLKEGGNNSLLEQNEISALHSFSKFLFDWLYSRNQCSAEEAREITDALARSINGKLKEGGAPYTINTEIIELEDSFISRFMNPSPRGPQTGRVKEIRAWCIQDNEQSICHRKASVLLV